jgi:cysteine desulfurase
MGVDRELARGAVRVSLGRDTVDDDITRFLSVFRQTVSQLNGLTAMAVQV